MLANSKLIAIGRQRRRRIPAPSASASFVHLMRRKPADHLHHRGQTAATASPKGSSRRRADVGSKLKTGVGQRPAAPIDTCALAIELGATFVGRSFSGDKKQLLSLLKAAAVAPRHGDARRPSRRAWTFNDHEGSTKSYAYAKEHDDPVEDVTFVPYFEDISRSITSPARRRK